MGLEVEDFQEIEAKPIKKAFTHLDAMLEDGDIRNNRQPGSTMHVTGRRMDLDMNSESDNVSDYSNTRVERIGTTRNRAIRGNKSNRSNSTESMGDFSMADIDDDIGASSGSDTEVVKEGK